jgi:hypothetical protein
MSSMSEIEFNRAKEEILKSITTLSFLVRQYVSYTDSLELGKDIISFLETNLPKLKLIKPLPIFEYKNQIESLDPNATSLEIKELKNKKLFPIDHKKFLAGLEKEIKKLKITDTQIIENKMSWEDALYQEMTVVMQREPNLKVKIISPVSMDDLINFKTNILKAIDEIKASPFPNFYKNVIKGNLILGTMKDIISEGLADNIKESGVAWYDDKTKNIIYKIEFAPLVSKRSIHITLIHEFAHKFHSTFKDGGFENLEIHFLYEEAIKSKAQCYLDRLPKIGDPLSDLREDWWSVRMSSENDYILSEIINDTYVYMNSQAKTIKIEKKDILKRITCPSAYGAKNHAEFFAEMVTLITLGLVKPNQKIIADKFISVVNS